MNKKIIFLILILLSVFIDVKALDNVLEVAGINYILNKDINEKTYSYTVSNNTLVLNNYNGSHIYKEGELNVIVNGDNYLSDNNGLMLIRADDLTVNGDGTLSFDSKNSCFSATNVSISDVTIRGTSTRELIYYSNELNINNVDIDFNASGILIFGGKVININNSIIKSNNRWGFRYTTNGVATINNSDINMECSVTCLSATAKMTFNKTNAYFYGKTSASSNMELHFENTSFAISEDGVNFQESVDYNDYPYLKTVTSINDEDNSSNQDNNSNDEDNNSNQDDNSNGEDSKDDSSLDNENNSSNDKNEDEFEDTSDVPKQDTDLNDNQENIDKENDNSFDNSKDNVDNDNIYTKGEYENKDEVYTKNEYDKEGFLNIENPKTYDGILNSIIILIFSVLIIVSIIIVRRNANGKI